MKDKKYLFIISALPVKNRQGASFARIFEYAKLLTRHKDVRVFILSTHYPEAMATSQMEILDNVFICGESKTSGKESFLKRTMKKIFSGINHRDFCNKAIDFISEFEGQKSVFIYPAINNYFDESTLLKRLKKERLMVYSERNELNIGRAYNKQFPKNIIKKIIYSIYYPFLVFDYYLQDKIVGRYDGNIVISTSFEKRIGKVNNNLIRVPILADVNKYHLDKPVNDAGKNIINIGYTGSLSIKKDGLDELIKAIGLLVNKYGNKNIHLNIYGMGYRDTIIKLKEMISNLGLNEYITLHGKVTSDKIPEVLSKQHILVLTRPKNLQTNYGFSTKLAEYMASSVPVLSTKVSDNGLYLEDGVNGFLINNHKAEETAAKLNEIISGKKYLDKVIKRNAYQTAKDHFNGNKYHDEMMAFLFKQV